MRLKVVALNALSSANKSRRRKEVICSRHGVSDQTCLISQCLAEQVTEEDLASGRVYPPLKKIRSVSLAIAHKVSEFAYEEGVAHFMPKPENLAAYLQSRMYVPTYDDALPEYCEWPEEALRSPRQ